MDRRTYLTTTGDGSILSVSLDLHQQVQHHIKPRHRPLALSCKSHWTAVVAAMQHRNRVSAVSDQARLQAHYKSAISWMTRYGLRVSDEARQSDGHRTGDRIGTGIWGKYLYEVDKESSETEMML